MSAPSFNLDTNSAVEGSELTSNRIEKSGAYTGTIKDAFYAESLRRAKYIELSMEMDDGKKADYLQIYFEGADGKILFGRKQIDALQAVLRLKTMNPKQTNTPEGQRWTYPDLIGKRIGVLLQKEFYFNSKNEEKYKFNILAPFNAETRQTAKEMIEKSLAETVNRIAATLIDKPAKGQKALSSNDFYQQSANAMTDFDDDVGF